MMLGFQAGGLIKKVESKRVLSSFDFPEQSIPELRPFFPPDLTFEHTLLDAHAVVLACLGDPPQTPAVHTSPVVHALPSLHPVPLPAVGFEQVPVF